MQCIILLLLLAATVTANFECPGRTNCSCTKTIRNDYELLCPEGIEPPSIFARVSPQNYVKIQCTASVRWEVLRLLAGLKIGPVNYLYLQDCPLPGTSYKELLKTMDIPTTDILDITRGNLSNKLTRKHLEGLTGTTKVNFIENSLTDLPEDLFADLNEIIWLDLRTNFVKLPKTIFRNTPKLDVLELGDNNMTYLEPGIFRNLVKLRNLNLWGNKLQNLSRGLFTDVPNIVNLDLKSNGLKNLPPDIFADLKMLKDINLSSNNFTSLPKGLFLSNINLGRVQLHSNRRNLSTLPDGLFANLTTLETLKLNDCNFKFFSKDLLHGTISLLSISLQNNLLETLPEEFFKDNKKLDVINLSYNKLNFLPERLFHSTSELKILNMAYNALTSLSGEMFAELTKLENLNLSNNKIKFINNDAFEKTISLKMIDLSNNQITKFDSDIPSAIDDPFSPRSLLKSCINKLETIYLAHNNITELYWDWILATNLELLDLSHNSISHLTYTDLLSVTAKNPTWDLSFNNISYIDMDGASALDDIPSEDKSEIRVMLKGNPIKCDCGSFELVNYFRNPRFPQKTGKVILDRSEVMCASGRDDLINQHIASVLPSKLTCRIEPCIENCACHYRPLDRALIVDCFNKSIEQMPLSMPNNETIKGLYFMTNHTELKISHNNIESLPQQLGPGYDRVTKMDLSYNKISKLHISTFSPSFTELYLDNNNIERLDSSSLKTLRELTKLEEITLVDNPWICDCEAIGWIDYVRSISNKVLNYNNLTCSSGLLMKEIKESEVCPLGTTYKVTISVVCAIVAICLAIGAIARLYLRHIKVWLYAHRMCLWFVTEEELDKDKIYDAFVSYSSLDENFVVEKLVPGLENGTPKYKLCLHYRDWIVGDFIPNQIARSVDESRRTIVVLSPNFLESVWGRMEFRAAHSQALSEGRARVILILYGDIGPTDKLDSELKTYLSMNTYVKWGDPWFWDKLRYALPHPMELSKKGVPLVPQSGKRRKRTSHSENLINGGTESNNILNTSITTPPVDSLIIDPLKLIDSKPS